MNDYALIISRVYGIIFFIRNTTTQPHIRTQHINPSPSSPAHISLAPPRFGTRTGIVLGWEQDAEWFNKWRRGSHKGKTKKKGEDETFVG